MKKIFLAMLLLVTFILSGCNTQAAGNQKKDSDLKIVMLNVGHGDAILIQTKEQTILIDTGKLDEQARFVNELEKFSVTKIDKLILTHPHSDHIGNARALINPNEKQLAENPYLGKISVGEVYDNGVPYTSSFYRNYMKAVNAKGINRQSLKVGDTLDFGGDVKFKVLFPTEEFVSEMKNLQADKSDDGNKENDEEAKTDRTYRMNNSSIVGKLTYKNFSMMLTGDCERESEAKILASNNVADLKCDVLKSGHHGRRSSSTKKFVAAVNPSYVLISAGNKVEENDPKGSPHAKPLLTYMEQGVAEKNIFCTQWNGSIIITSDGKNFSVQPEVKKDWIKDWIAKKQEAKVI